MVGRKVKHKIFGEGKIVSKPDNKIIIQFPDCKKTFCYPDVFKKYLTTDDLKLKKIVEDDIAYDEKQKKLEKEQIKLDREKSEKTSDKLPKKQPQTKSQVNSKKNNEPLNIAFRYNYCDGGKTSTSIGFNGVCSEDIMECNVEASGSNCANSFCRGYINGEMDRTEFDELVANYDYICYESALLRKWMAYAGGTVKTNKPKSIARAEKMNNKLAIMTTCETKLFNGSSSEAERFIFAVFLIEEAFAGDDKQEGYVKADSKWRMELSPQEAKQILFWNYYQNPNAPDEIKWSQGLFRYISDEQTEKILKDIVKVKNNQAEKDFAQKFLDYYISKNS